MKFIKTLLINGIVLAAASVILRFADVVFNAYISRHIGTEGMGIYHLILSTYIIGINVAISGIGLASTRLVAEELACGNEQGAKTAVIRCLIYASFFGMLSFLLLFFLAPFIATHFLKNEITELPLKILAFTLPFVAVSSVFSGYFMAVRRSAKTASGQMIENFSRMAIIVFLLSKVMPEGLIYSFISLGLGSVISEIISFSWLFILYFHDKRRYKNLRKSDDLTKRMLSVSVPVALSTYLKSGLSGLKHMMIPIWLAKSGMGSHNALSDYGLICGMAMPLMMFPSAMVTAFSSLIIPEVARLYVKNNTEGIKRAISAIFKITLAFAIGVSGILVCFSNELGIAVYKKAEVGVYLKILAPLAVIMYFDEVVDGLLKGINRQVSVVRINIIDTLSCIALITVLLPQFGIKGYIIMIFVSELLNGILSIGCLIRNADFDIKFIDWVIKPLFYITVSCFVAVKVTNNFVLGIIISIFIYVFFGVLRTKGVRLQKRWNP